jgi:hypothetical protein
MPRPTRVVFRDRNQPPFGMNPRTRKEGTMNVAWWVGFVGAGVVLSACGGYSSLGEVAAVGGENGDGDATGGSQSMGANGGRQGHGGTGMSTGGTGMGATGGTGMDATGGTEMGTGAGGTGMGAYGGTGMASGGGPDMGMPCMTAADCPSAPPFCLLCADGTPSCPEPICSDSTCGFEQPRCPTGPDERLRCMVAEDCPTGHSCDMCADGSVSCAESFCADGYCGTAGPACPETPCAHRAFCDPCMAPDGVAGRCDEDGACVIDALLCDTPDMCASDDDCSRDAVCFLCADGSCADGGCIEGQCGSVCPADYPCMTPMDCPKTIPDDPCTTGPWLCVHGACAREYQTCMTPRQ